jgi:hypothetical protein
MILKGGIVRAFGNTPNETKFHSGRNHVQTEVRECLLSFGAEHIVFQWDIQKYTDYDIQNDTFACCFVWVWNMVADIEGGM